MKKIMVVLSLSIGFILSSCGGNNTATNMPDSGYQPRTDSAANTPATTSEAPSGGVAIDSVKNGQFNVSGVSDSAIKKHDSAGKK